MLEEDAEAVSGRWIANRCHWTSFPKNTRHRLGFESPTRKNAPRVSLLSDWFYRNGRRINIAAKDLRQVHEKSARLVGDLDMAAVSLTRSFLRMCRRNERPSHERRQIPNNTPNYRISLIGTHLRTGFIVGPS